MLVQGRLDAPYYLVWDQQTKLDSQFDRHSGGSNVYASLPILRAMAGDSRLLCKIALCTYNATKVDVKSTQAFLRAIEQHHPRHIFIFPTLSKAQLRGEAAISGATHAWNALKPPASMDEMRGTNWHTHETVVTAMFPLHNSVDETQKFIDKQWLTRAGTAPRHVPVGRLEDMRGQPLAIDIETIDSRGVITAVGLATRTAAVSLVWDEYQPSKPGTAIVQRLPSQTRSLVQELINAAPVILGHNVLYDIRRLEAAGIHVPLDRVHDTLAAHAIVFPTLPHGLQKACAHLFAVPPWKSLFKTEYPKDDERHWFYDPDKLHVYNREDAFRTVQLWEALQKWL